MLESWRAVDASLIVAAKIVKDEDVAVSLNAAMSAGDVLFLKHDGVAGIAANRDWLISQEDDFAPGRAGDSVQSGSQRHVIRSARNFTPRAER